MRRHTIIRKRFAMRRRARTLRRRRHVIPDVTSFIREVIVKGFFFGFILLFSVLFNASVFAQTQSGTLDTSFGSDGKVTNNFGGRIALQPDGKILAAGAASAADGFDFSLSRFNSNGTLDTTFGSGGRVTTDLGGRFEGA